jgi:hypothetical protein
MNTILGPIVERLRALPSSLMETVAAEAVVPLSLPRKLRARDRTDPKLSTIQPLVNYFARIDAGELALPTKPLPASVIAAKDRARVKALERLAARTANAPRKAGRPPSASRSKAAAPASR